MSSMIFPEQDSHTEYSDIVEVHKETSSITSETSRKSCTKYDCCCSCYKDPQPILVVNKETNDLNKYNELLQKKEEELRREYNEALEKETQYLKERFDFILQNEQIRSSYKLREAHRERKEKIRILQQQLECKNLAGLMYVMCAERARSKFEKLQIIEKYTNYINMLNEILAEGQEIILNLSRGYKTAARVDYEWQQKMKKVICEFQHFVYNFAGGTPEQNQYYFDLPSILQSDAPKEDDPLEDPIEDEEEPEYLSFEDSPEKQNWWERLDDENRPFAVFGDMADFKPDQRRETLKRVKAPKTAPKKWKEYAFREMFLRSDCPNADSIKNDYLSRLPDPHEWECQPVVNEGTKGESRVASRRVTTASVDLRGNMGSILKIMTASGMFPAQPVTKANLLGARDSMEIASNTKVRDKQKSIDTEKVELQIGSRRQSFFEDNTRLRDVTEESPLDHYTPQREITLQQRESVLAKRSSMSSRASRDSKARKESVIEDHYELTFEKSESQVDTKLDDADAGTMKGHHDSLTMVNHVPERDHKINYEKICPTEECKRRKMDSFIQSLPVYMQENTYTYREQTFEQYEPCTPEQLEILKERMEETKKRNKERKLRASRLDANPLLEWKASVEGVGCQTSVLSFQDLPPCTCKDSSLLSETGNVYKLENLIPVKQQLNRIQKECLYNSQIEFNRFKVLGQDSSDSVRVQNQLINPDTNFTSKRLQEIRKILKQHPSLCEIFQANTGC